MERIMRKDGSLLSTVAAAGVLLAVAFALVVVAYGMETVAPGVHDTFHDFRHVIGMPCH